MPLQLPPLTVRAPADVESGYWDVVQVERGQTLHGGIDGLGEQRQKIVPFKGRG